jgi:hypothetical protein
VGWFDGKGVCFQSKGQVLQPYFGQVWGWSPTLGKSGFEILWDSWMFRARQQGPKHLALRCSWCHWKGLEA